jgi:hypothetical protein
MFGRPGEVAGFDGQGGERLADLVDHRHRHRSQGLETLGLEQQAVASLQHDPRGLLRVGEAPREPGDQHDRGNAQMQLQPRRIVQLAGRIGKEGQDLRHDGQPGGNAAVAQADPGARQQSRRRLRAQPGAPQGNRQQQAARQDERILQYRTPRGRPGQSLPRTARQRRDPQQGRRQHEDAEQVSHG